jgi:hypothetical protein
VSNKLSLANKFRERLRPSCYTTHVAACAAAGKIPRRISNIGIENLH